MAEELAFKDEAAAEYDRAFAHVTAHFMPFLRGVSPSCANLVATAEDRNKDGRPFIIKLTSGLEDI
jgi:hypothetical protein